jgi:hypothetical protein
VTTTAKLPSRASAKKFAFKKGTAVYTMGAAAAMLTSLYTNLQRNIQAIHHCHATDFDAVSFFMIAIAFFIP